MKNLWNKLKLRKFKEFASPLSPEIFIYSTHISLKHNYLYVETPKVACSTIKKTLQTMEVENVNFHRDNPNIKVHENSLLLSPSSVGDFQKLLNSEIFKFCFSRNPYTRLLSAYLQKICTNRPQKKLILRQLPPMILVNIFLLKTL